MIKQCLVMGLAAVVAGSFMVAQAGTSRSGGGHSMVNARNFSATRSLGGRSGGGHFAGFSRANLDSLRKAMTEFRNRIGVASYQKGSFANYIRAHGGVVTVNVDKSNHSFGAQGTTGRGGEFSVNTQRVGAWTNTVNGGTFAGAGSKYQHTAAIKTANRNTYYGNGTSSIAVESSAGAVDGIPTVSFGRSRSGQATINGHQLPISGSTSLTVNEEGQVNVVHERELGEYFSDMGKHEVTITMSKSDNGTVINRKEEGNLTGVNGNNVQSSTETTVTKAMNSEIKVEHPNAESQYILYNGQPIGKV